MRSLLILIALAASALSLPAAASECLPSAEAVWQEHPGTHATYRGTGNHKCWMVKGERHDRRSVSHRMDADDDRGARHSRRDASVIPIPRERPSNMARPDGGMRHAAAPATAAKADPVGMTSATGTNRLTLQQGYEEGARLLSIRLGADVVLKYGAKLAEVGR